MDNNKSIVDRIRLLANAQGLNLPNLEMRLNLGNGTISRWSKSSPNTDKLLRVADYFHVPIDYLLGREPSSYDNEYGRTLSSLREPVSLSVVSDFPQPMPSDEDVAASLCAIKDMTAMPLSETERDIIQKFRHLDNRGQSAVLNVLNHEYDSLPGKRADPAAKEA